MATVTPFKRVMQCPSKLLHIFVYREGAPETKQEISMDVPLEHAQSQWRSLLHKIERTLQVEDVEGIFEEYKMVPVYRVLSIVDGGVYVARPTPNCALLRALADDEALERFPGHPFIESMRAAKLDLKTKKDEWEDSLPQQTLESGASTHECLKLLALPIDAYEADYISVYRKSVQHPLQASREDMVTLEFIQQVRDPSGLMDILRRSSSAVEETQAGTATELARGLVIGNLLNGSGEDKQAGFESLGGAETSSHPIRVSSKQLRLLLMKTASLLAQSAVHRSAFLKREHCGLIMAHLHRVQTDDLLQCQYGLWILTHFASRLEYQAHLTSVGLPSFLLKCLQTAHKPDPNTGALLLRVLIALYACLKLHQPNCQEHSAALVPAVISVLRVFEDSAKMNLFGCWAIQEMVTYDGKIAERDLVKQIQAIFTRFYDDEIVHSAAEELLAILATSASDTEVVEARRLGIARGALS